MIVPVLSGISVEAAKLLNYSARLKIVAEDPVSVAEYFNLFVEIVVEKIFKKGLFGKYVAHYGVVETQGRGGLHLHCLLWIDGVPEPAELNRRLREENEFRQRVVQYREFLVCESLDEEIMSAVNDGSASSTQSLDAPVSIDITQPAFLKEASLLASQVNMHKRTHTASCRKFGTKECRFNFPRSLIPESVYDETTGGILSSRNNEWLNPYNLVLMYLLRCNHDIQLLSTSSDALALIYYITDYATKRQLKSYELFNFIAAGIKKLRNDLNVNSETEEALSLSRRGLMKCINTIGSTQEISGPLCALQILYEKESYTNEIFVNVNWKSILLWYERHMSSREHRTLIENWDDDQVVFSHQPRHGLSNLRIDYVFRGSDNNIDKINLYTYASTVYKDRGRISDVGKRCSFLLQHPQSQTHSQKIREKHESCVVLIGKAFPDFEKEKEDFCSAMLILLKPWSALEPLKLDDQSWEDAFHAFFDSAGPTTGNPFHDRYSIPSVTRLMRNIQSLKRCKDAAEVSRAEFAIDAALEEKSQSEDILGEFTEYDIQISDAENDLGSDGEIMILQLEERSTSSDSYLMSEIFTLRAFERLSSFVKSRNFTIPSFQYPHGITASENVQQWTEAQASTNEVSAEDEINCLRFQRLLQEVSIPFNVLQCLDGFDLVGVIGQKRMLNPEQRRAFAIVAIHEDEANGNNIMMYVGGAAGTGKSEVVKAIQEYFLIREKNHKLLLSASTGTAASKLSGNTIHSLCKISINHKSEDEGTKRLSKKNLALRTSWAPVEYLIIDEISMVSADLLGKISTTLQYAKECPDKPFGGVNVIAFGDFFQFPPVFGWPLYSNVVHRDNGQRESNRFIEDSLTGLHAWQQFENVVMLTKNYRQERDVRYQQLLLNHLENGLTTEDIHLLKSRVISPVLEPPGDVQIIVNRNTLRTTINDHFIEDICRTQQLQLTTVVAADSCSNAAFNMDQPGMREKLLSMDDNKTEQLPGILKLFVGMRCMVTANVDTAKGLSNGSLGVIYSIPESSNDDRPSYILFKLRDESQVLYNGLPPGVVPIFQRTGSFKVRLKNRQKSSVTIRRRQFPLVPAYAITDYKSQGETLQSALLDIRRPPTGNWASFFALYVLLSRVATLDGLYLIHDFDEAVFKSRPPAEINHLMEKLRQLNDRTKTLFDARHMQ